MSDRIIDKTTQFLTFTLAGEVFGVEIAQVKEVLEYTVLTKIPKTPDFMRGVINLRGGVVPVVDMRRKFGMPEMERTVNTCIIILDVVSGEGSLIVGAVADSVKEVRNLDPDQVEPPPRIGTALRTDFIRGMGKQDDHFIILLNTDRVFSSEEMGQLQEAGKPEKEVSAA